MAKWTSGVRRLDAFDQACAILSAGSEIAGEAAAGLAAAYIALKANSGASSADLASYLTHAKQLYSFATSAQGSYQDLTSECLAQHGVGLLFVAVVLLWRVCFLGH